MSEYKITRMKDRKAEIEIPHEKSRITFLSPAIGPDNYAKVQEAITHKGLIPPTMAQTSSLIYAANKNHNEDEFSEIFDKLDDSYSGQVEGCLKFVIWGYTGILYVPNEGAYIQDNPLIKKGRVSMNRSKLVKKLEANDKSVRFVPFGYKLNGQKGSELGKNPFVIGLAGEEGAEKLAEVSGKYGARPTIWSFNNIDEERAVVSSLCGRYYDHGLNIGGIGGYYYGDGKAGHAFGMKKD
jgi:hypothetical protein